MHFALRLRPRSDDYDIVDDDGASFGQVIHSANGYTIYLLGDFERLFPPHDTADAALEAFEDWAASNTITNIPTISGGESSQ
jgi:hypothetical protein